MNPKFMLISIFNKYKPSIIFTIFFLLLLTTIITVYNTQKTSKGIVINKPEKSSDGQVITDVIAFFATQTINIRNKTEVTIPYIPPKKDTEIWLSLALENDNLVSVLVHHPSLMNITWQYLNDGMYTLYQKEPNFKSIQEFLDNLPQNKAIQADPQAIKEFSLNNENIKELATDIDFNTVDYILTTFKPHYQLNQYTVFKTTIDASKAKIVNNLLDWKLTMANVNKDNPLIIRGVEVNFAQPVRIQ